MLLFNKFDFNAMILFNHTKSHLYRCIKVNTSSILLRISTCSLFARHKTKKTRSFMRKQATNSNARQTTTPYHLVAQQVSC